MCADSLENRHSEACRQFTGIHLCARHHSSSVTLRLRFNFPQPGELLAKLIFVKALIGSMAADIAEDELISVGRRVGDAGRSHHAAGAGNVFDNDPVTQKFR
jgi:hypothetical protein